MQSECHVSNGRIIAGVLRDRMARTLNGICEDVATPTARAPRNIWILEALVEKLNREKRSLRSGTRRGADDGQE